MAEALGAVRDKNAINPPPTFAPSADLVAGGQAPSSATNDPFNLLGGPTDEDRANLGDQNAEAMPFGPPAPTNDNGPGAPSGIALPNVALPKPGPGGRMTVTINGVPLNMTQMQPDDTGAPGVGNVQEVADNLARLSPSTLDRLQKRGISWIVVPDSLDQAFPYANLTKVRASDWPPGKDDGDVGGSFVVDQPYQHRGEQDAVIGTGGLDGSANVTLHETGHAWDAINNMPSQHGEFPEAYEGDVPLMTSKDEYYLKPRDKWGLYVGRSEAYAESFARFISGDASLQKEWPHMYQYWIQQDKKYGLRNLSGTTHQSP
jgi:hypothetical protein